MITLKAENSENVKIPVPGGGVHLMAITSYDVVSRFRCQPLLKITEMVAMAIPLVIRHFQGKLITA